MVPKHKLFGMVLLLVAALLINSAGASLADVESTYVDGNGKSWQGSVFYGNDVDPSAPNYQDGLRGRVDFAVYDQEKVDNSAAETALLEQLALSGRYVYVYQIFNDYENYSDSPVGTFGLLDIGGGDLDSSHFGDIGSSDDGAGVDPESASDGEWFFKGYLVAGDYSNYLIFSSSIAPVVGTYEINTFEDDDFPVIPEPSSIALFGLMAVGFVRKRK